MAQKKTPLGIQKYNILTDKWVREPPVCAPHASEVAGAHLRLV